MPGVPKPDELDDAVVAYTTPWCGYCIAARRLLKKRSIEFREVDVAGEPEARRWLAQASGQRTVPQIFIDGRSIGGFAELLALDQGGQLKPGATRAG